MLSHDFAEDGLRGLYSSYERTRIVSEISTHEVC